MSEPKSNCLDAKGNCPTYFHYFKLKEMLEVDGIKTKSRSSLLWLQLQTEMDFTGNILKCYIRVHKKKKLTCLSNWHTDGKPVTQGCLGCPLLLSLSHHGNGLIQFNCFGVNPSCHCEGRSTSCNAFNWLRMGQKQHWEWKSGDMGSTPCVSASPSARGDNGAACFCQAF